MIKVLDLAMKRWNAYWFRPIPVLNIAICRIIIVAALLINLVTATSIKRLLILSNLPDSLYNPHSLIKLLCLPFGWNYRPPFALLEIIYWFTLIAGLTSLIGLKTNISLLTFAGGNIFLRAYTYSFGAIYHVDAVIVMAVSVLALSPSGRVLSLDALQHRHRQLNLMDRDNVAARWSLLLIQWIFAITYFDAAISKLTSGASLISLDWMNGYTLQAYLLKPGKPGFHLGNWLGQNHRLALISSWIAILFEGTFPVVLIFRKLVWIYIPLGILLHTGIFLTMGLPFLMLMATYVVFIPWSSVIKTLSRR